MTLENKELKREEYILWVDVFTASYSNRIQAFLTSKEYRNTTEGSNQPYAAQMARSDANYAVRYFRSLEGQELAYE